MLYQYRNKMSSRWNKQGYNNEEQNGIQYTKFPHTNHLLPHFITTFKSKQQQNHTRIYFVYFKYTFSLPTQSVNSSSDGSNFISMSA